jgi:hypothetical protein
MKAAKLIIEYDYNFEVLALISSVKDYKLAFNINNKLNVQLKKTDDICLVFVNESELTVSQYLFETEFRTLRLLKNKSLEAKNMSKPYLVPELKEYDYFIHLSGEGEVWESENIIENLKSLPVIQYVQKVDLNNLKSRENLIF